MTLIYAHGILVLKSGTTAVREIQACGYRQVKGHRILRFSWSPAPPFKVSKKQN